MRKIIIAIVLSLSSLGLVACGGSGSGTPGVSTPSVNTDSVFIQVVRQNLPEVSDSTDASLIQLGHTVCTKLDQGLPVMQIVSVFVENGLPAFDSGFFVGASIQAYCPEHDDLLPTDSPS